jgi:hypothetical protein
LLRWAKLSVAMAGRMRNNFVFVVRCASEEVFFDRFTRGVLAKRSSNVEFGEILLVPFSL